MSKCHEITEQFIGEYNENDDDNAKNVGGLKHALQVATMPKTRKQNFPKKDYDLAKRLLREYDEAVQPCGKGDKTRQTMHMTKAFEAFLAEAESKDTTRDQFRKLLSRIRTTKAAKPSSSLSATTSTESNINKLICDEFDAFANSDENTVESETTPSDGEVKNIEEDVKQMKSSAQIGIVIMKSPTVMARSMDDQGLSDTLEMLHLQNITVGEWILIQRATFDIHVNGEPYHSIQIYANLKTMTFIRRVWGISEINGELKTMEDLRDLCIATFNKSMVCLGQIEPPPQRDLELMLVKYPFSRWISKSCSIRYAQEQDGQIIGICSACSCGVSRIKKVSSKGEMEGEAMLLIIGDDVVAYEYEAEETIKYENEDIPEGRNISADISKLYDCKECPFQAIKWEGLKDHLRREHFSCSEEKDSNGVLTWEKDDIDEIPDDTKITPESFSMEENREQVVPDELDAGAHSDEITEEYIGGNNENNDDNADYVGELKHALQVATMPKSRKQNFPKKDYDLAKRLLHEYDEAVQPCGKGDKMRQTLHMTKAYEAFLAEAESKDTTRDQFRKLLSRIRRTKAAKSLSSTLQRHFRGKHKSTKSVPIVKEPQTCDQCGLILSSMCSLKSHMKLIHSTYSEREYKCDSKGCKKSFGTAGSLRQHKGSHGEKDFVCDHCGKGYSSNDSLSYHLKSRHEAIPTLQLKCKHCDKVFGDYLRRVCHTNLVHFPDKYKCSLCQKRYGTGYFLKRHTKLAHTSGSYDCQECGKKFTQVTGLKIHMRLHTGDQFNCRYCPWKGNRGSELYRHIVKQHLKEWERDEASKSDNFRCSECGDYMLNDDHLSCHIRVRHRENIGGAFGAH